MYDWRKVVIECADDFETVSKFLSEVTGLSISSVGAKASYVMVDPDGTFINTFHYVASYLAQGWAIDNAYEYLSYEDFLEVCAEYEPVRTGSCSSHEYVNISFAHMHMACKHCGEDQE